MRTLIPMLIAFTTATAFAQENQFSAQHAVDFALRNNENIKAAGYEVESQRQLKKTSFDLPKMDVSLLYGQYNSYAKDNNITVTQTIPFSAFGSQGRLNSSLLASSELKKRMSENEIRYRVRRIYYGLQHAYANHELLLQQDSIFEGFFRSASIRYKTGETNLLEQTTAEAQRNEAKNKIRQNDSNILSLRSQLKALLNAPLLPEIQHERLEQIPLSLSLDSSLLSTSPSLIYSKQQIDVAQKEKKVAAAKAAPDLLVGFFSQTLAGTVNPETSAVANSSQRFTGFQVGVSLPLWFVPQQGRVRAAEYNRKMAVSNYTYNVAQFEAELMQAIQNFETSKLSLEYYNTSALPNADLILKQSQAAFKGGEIGYSEYLLGVRNAISIKENYLQTLNNYNQSIIFIEFLSGQN